MKMLRDLLLSLVVVTMAVGPGMAFGEVIPIFTEDLSAFNEKIQDPTGYNIANDVVPPVTVFNDGNALYMMDMDTGEKPELRGEFASPLMGPFRIDIQSYDMSTAGTSKAIRFRMSNAGDSVTSESRAAFSLSWQADGKFNAKYSDGGLNDFDPDDVDTKSTDPLVGVQNITMIANGAVAGTYAYNLFGESRTLNPLHYDVYVNGALLNSGTDAWFANGMKFTLEKSAGTYDPSLGLGQFGIMGSSDSDVGPDYLFDNIVVSTGPNIPEPATFSLLLGALVGLRLFRRRG